MATAEMLNRLERLERNVIAPPMELVIIHAVGHGNFDLVGLSGVMEGFQKRHGESGTAYAARAKKYVADTMRCAGPLVVFGWHEGDEPE